MKTFATYAIDAEAGLAWAREKHLCLIPEALDVTAVKKLATVQALPFVPQVAKDGSQAVADVTPASFGTAALEFGYDSAKCLAKDDTGKCVREVRDKVIAGGNRPLAGYGMAWSWIENRNNQRALDAMYEAQKNTITGRAAEWLVDDHIDVNPLPEKFYRNALVMPIDPRFRAAQEENRRLLQEKKEADARDREFNRRERCRRDPKACIVNSAKALEEQTRKVVERQKLIEELRNRY